MMVDITFFGLKTPKIPHFTSFFLVIALKIALILQLLIDIILAYIDNG